MSVSETPTTVTVPPVATHFSVTPPAAAVVGKAFSFTINALDASNNPVTAYAGTVHFSSSDAAATLPANAALSGGAGTFQTTLRTTGSQTITATDTVNSGLTGTGSIPVFLTAGPATHFLVVGPASVVVGVGFTFTTTALDSNGNIATSYAGTVHYNNNGLVGLLPQPSPLTNGVASFGATFWLSWSPPIQTITATDVADPSITGTSAGIAVGTSAAATRFSVTAPGAATLGTGFNFTVTALDASGNVVTGYSGTVRFSRSDGAA